MYVTIFIVLVINVSIAKLGVCDVCCGQCRNEPNPERIEKRRHRNHISEGVNITQTFHGRTDI